MKKAFVFDFDDTLAITDACVLLRHAAGDELFLPVKLTPSEFNDYELKEGESFDFSEFRCASLIENGRPKELITLAKEVYDENHPVYILTARSNDVSDAIAKFLRLHGIEAKQIICVGDDDKDGDIANSKRRSLLTIMKLYDKIYYYDDCPKNIELAPKGKNIRKYKV
jgi:FMN phosphatase YigB (HAD superfamily)|tara:strand:+ start:2324 stop:2827 length:504 start_codon:yes stop_codon:yes gene_type:complete